MGDMATGMAKQKQSAAMRWMRPRTAFVAAAVAVLGMLGGSKDAVAEIEQLQSLKARGTHPGDVHGTDAAIQAAGVPCLWLACHHHGHAAAQDSNIHCSAELSVGR